MLVDPEFSGLETFSTPSVNESVKETIVFDTRVNNVYQSTQKLRHASLDTNTDDSGLGSESCDSFSSTDESVKDNVFDLPDSDTVHLGKEPEPLPPEVSNPQCYSLWVKQPDYFGLTL